MIMTRVINSGLKLGSSPLKSVRKLFNGRTVRIGFGVIFLGAVVWIVAPHLFNTISSRAVINARVFPLVSAIRGTVTTAPPRPGRIVYKNDLIAVVEDRTVDSIVLLRDRAEIEGLWARIAARGKTLAELATLKNRLIKQGQAYKRANIARLTLELAEARAQTRAAAADAEQAGKQLERRRILIRKGVERRAALDAAEAVATRTAAELDSARAVATRLENELAALKRGVFAGRDRNDVPYSRQRTDEISLRETEIRNQIREYRIRIDALSPVVSAEEKRDVARSRFELRAPTRGVIWRTFADLQGAIARNGAIASMIDCTRMIINVVLHERYFEDIKSGDPATVQVLGSSEVLNAYVISLQGMGANPADDRLAARIPEIEARQFLVTLAVDDRGLTSRKNDFCHVGRSAEVRFKRQHGFLKHLFHLLTAADRPWRRRDRMLASSQAGATAS